MKKLNNSISVIVPAFNEAPNLPGVVQSIHEALDTMLDGYEILIINDGSSDDTGKVAEELAKRDALVKVIHNPHNMGYGFTFQRGLAEASKEYIQIVPGDGEIPANSVATISAGIGEADMIIPYMLNFRTRPMSRKVISWLYTATLNVLFGNRLYYYNGPWAIRTKLVKEVPLNTHGFAFMASIVLRLIKRGYSFIEVGIMLQPRQGGKTKIFAIRNILSVIKTVAWLFWDITFNERSRKAEK